MKRKFNFVVVLLCVFCVGCAGLGIKLDTKEKQLFAARTELNLLLEFNIGIQDQFSEKYHQRARAAFTTADEVIDTWEAIVIGGGNPSFQNIEDWLSAKKAIMDVLRGVYGR